MGTWGAGSFENDDALDWTMEACEAGTLTPVREALRRVNECTGYLEAPECFSALAAVETVAAMNGRPAAEMPEELGAFVARVPREGSDELHAAALRALERIGAKSELRDLWDEADSLDEWLEALSELKGRLSRTPG